MMDTPFEKFVPANEQYFEEKSPAKFLEQIKKQIKTIGIYDLEEVYLTEQQSDLCPILIKYGKSLLSSNLNIKQTFILQVWNRNGEVIWQKDVPNKVKVAHISQNYDRKRFNQSCNTFVYVLDDDKNEIQIVVFNTDLESSAKVHISYKINDWMNVFSKENRLKDSICVSSKNLLVLLTSQKIHYVSLTQLLQDKEDVELQSSIKIEIPQEMLKSVYLNDQEQDGQLEQDQMAFTTIKTRFRGLFMQKSNKNTDDSQQDVTVYFDRELNTEKGNYMEPLGFLFLAESEDGSLLNLEVKHMNNFIQEKRTSLGKLEKIMFFGQYDQGTNSSDHYGVVQYSNHCFDFYYNCTLVHSITHEYKCTEDQSSILFEDMVHNKKQIFLFGKNKNSNEHTVYKTHVKQGKKLGEKLIKENFQAKEALREKCNLTWINTFYKPYSSFNQCNKEFYLTHGKLVSVKKFGQLGWEHHQLDQYEKSDDLIIHGFVNKDKKSDQMCILTQNSRVIKLQPEKFPFFSQDEKDIITLEGHIKQYLVDRMQHFHLIQTDLKKVYILRNTQQFLPSTKTEKREMPDNQKNASIIVNITDQLTSEGIDIANSSFAVVFMQREISVFAALKRIQDDKISIKIFQVSKNMHDVVDLQVNVIAILEVPQINKRVKVLDIKNCSQIIISFEEDRRSGVLIALAGQHWLTVRFVREVKVKVETKQSKAQNKFINIFAKRIASITPAIEKLRQATFVAKKTVLHLNMFISQVFLVDNFIYTTHEDITMKNISYDEKVERNLRVDHFTTPRDETSFITHDGIGIIDLNAYKIDLNSRPQIIPLSNTFTGNNSSITYDPALQSLSYRLETNAQELLPLPHRNEIPFEKSGPRTSFLISKQIDNFFVAITRQAGKQAPMFKVWQVSSGKLVEAFRIQSNLVKNSDGQYLEKPTFVGVEQPDKELMESFFGDFQVWEGQSTQNQYQNSAFAGSKKAPGYYEQDLFAYSILYKQGPPDLSRFTLKNGIIQQNQEINTSNERKDNCLIRLVELKLDKWKVPYNDEKGNPRIAIKIKPWVKVHFEFKWNRSIQNFQWANLFISKFDKTLSNIKLMETFWPQVRVYSFKQASIEQKNKRFPRLEVDKTSMVNLKMFPSELYCNPYNAYDSFDPYLKYYIDWDFALEQFKIIDVKTEQPVYSFSKTLLQLNYVDISKVMMQLTFMTWYNEDHVILANSQSTDCQIKVLKVIYPQEEGNNKLKLYQGEEQLEDHSEDLTIPYLENFKRLKSSELFNMFRGQIFNDPKDTKLEYMKKHNMITKYLYLDRLSELSNPDRPEFLDIVQNQDDLKRKNKLTERKQHQNSIRQLNNKLYTVDYVRHVRFMIQLPFSVYDWCFINTLGKIKEWTEKTNKKGDFGYLRQLVKQNAVNASLCILPRGRTLLSESISNLEFIQNVEKAVQLTNKERPLKFDIPFIKNFKGQSPMHEALLSENPQEQVASFFFKFLSTQRQLGQHSREIIDILPHAVNLNLTSMVEYLNSRKISTEHLQSSVIKKVGQFETNERYKMHIVSASAIWQPAFKIKADENLLLPSKSHNIVYFYLLDFPNMSNLTAGSVADQLMISLSNITSDEDWRGIFNSSVIQTMIDYRWYFIKPIVFWALLVPYMLQVVSYVLFSFWCTYYDGVEPENEQAFKTMEQQVLACEITFIVISLYNLTLEILKMRGIGCQEYFRSEKGSFQNIQQLFVNILIPVMAFVIRFYPITIRTYLGIASTLLMLLTRIIYFFGVFYEFSKILKIIETVTIRLVPFFMVFFLFTLIVTIPFIIFNNQLDGLMFGDTSQVSKTFDKIFTIYMTSIGEYGFTGNIPNNKVVGAFSWALFVVTTLLLQLIMMNLIIAIISSIYEQVIEETTAACYMVRCSLVVEHMHLIRNSVKQKMNSKGKWLISAKKWNFDTQN